MDRLIKTLDGEKPKFHPNCFYLSWTKNGTMPRYEATWCSYRDINKSFNKFTATVKWKDLNMDIIIASDYVGEPYTVDMDNTYQSKEFLKSHLQKAIRRSNPYKALLTAWHFLDLDLEDYLRRLCIIALEDCLPLQGYSTLVWFMMAVSKGYKLSDEQICWLLGYTYDLCNCEHYEQIIAEDIPLKTIKMRTLSQDGKNLVYSIVARKSYGGMRGDKNMCLAFAKLWSSRFNTASRFNNLLSRDVKFITPPKSVLQKSEWILGAIDFHCAPNIIIAMWEKHDEYSNDEIRSAIWHCSSSITNKKLLTDDYKQRLNSGKYLEVWKVIKKDFLSYSKYLLSRNG